MPSQSRGPSQSQGVAPQQEVAPKGPTPDVSGGVGNSEVAASIGKAPAEEPSALLAPEPALQLKPGAEPAPAPEAEAPEAKAPVAKAPEAKDAQLKPGAKAPEEEKAAGTAKGDVDAGKQGEKAAGKGAKDLKADKGEKVAAKAKDAGPVDKGGGDGKPGKGGGGDAPPAEAKGGGAPAKGDKGGNAAAAFNAASGSGGGGGGRKSEGPAASPGPSPAPVANKPTGGAPTGGGGGGGGGGRAPGGSAVGAVAQEAAPIAEIPVADNVKDTMSNFANASPSQQANAWPTLGAALDAKSEAETTKLDESVPEFHAVLGGDSNAGGGTTDVATPGMVSNLAGEAGGAVPEPVLAPTIDPGQARYNQGVTTGLDRLGAEAAEDQKARAISAGIGAIQTSDGAVAVSPGAAPLVPLEGASDPARIGIQTGSMNDEAAAALTKAREAVVASPGSELVQPLEMDEAFEVPALAMEGIADAPEAADMQKYVEQALPADIQASFDEINAPEFEASLADAEGQVGSAVDSRDSEAQVALDKASAENAKMASDAQAQQEASVAAQRGAITSKRDETMAAQASAVASARGEANDASMAEQRRIDTRIAQDNAKITNEYGRAEQQAQDKVAQGEREAADKKRKAEEDAENKSWWEKACDWVAEALSALADIINSIFDAIRSAVTAILDAVKSLANAIIDAAVSFIQDAIAALGSLLKGLIQGLLGDIFPGLADALCSFVDGAVKFAQEQVAVIGDKLKKAVAAACDVVAGVLNKILDVFQSAVNMAIAIASAAITGDWNAVLMKMIEAALRICGIDPEEFYAYVGKAEDTIQIILDDPGHFIGNIIEAVGMGFGQFGDNFLDHLQNGFVGWLTGQSGDAGITMPDDPMSGGGVLDIALQVLGITPEGIEEMATERIGEENVEKVKFVWGFVESAISGGLEGLWDHLSEFLDGIYDEVIGAIQEWLMEKVVMAAISKIATMWNPIGAIVQALITAWNVYQWLQAQAARIMGIVKSVVDSMHDIATGNLGGAANMVEGALAGLVPVAIDLLASLLGISGIGKKVQEIVGGIRTWVKDAINKMIDKFLGLFTGGGKDDKKEEQPEDAKPEDKKPDAEADVGTLTLDGNWGTSSPILYHYKAPDREDLAELRAHGSYQLEIVDGAAADRQWKRGEGDNAKYDNKGMHDWTRSLLLKHFTTNVANAHMPVDDVIVATAYKGFEMATVMGLNGELAAYGMKAKGINIQMIDSKGNEKDAKGGPGPEVEAALEKRRPFEGEKKHSHHMWIEVDLAAGTFVPMVASTPITAEAQLAQWAGKVSTLPADQQVTANEKLAAVGPPVAALRALSDQLKAIPGDDDAAKAARRTKSGEIATASTPVMAILGELFKIFGGDFGLGATALDPSGAEAYAKFEERVKDMFKLLGNRPGAAAAAQDMWAKLITTFKKTDPGMAQVAGSSAEKGRIDMASAEYQNLLPHFDPIIEDLKRFGASDFSKHNKIAFWSKACAQALARKRGYLILEDSGFAKLFDQINFTGDWDMELWGAMSRAYAEAVAAQSRKMEVHGFVGPGVTEETVFSRVEHPAIEAALAKNLEWDVKYIAVAAKDAAGSEFNPSPETYGEDPSRPAMVKLASDEHLKRFPTARMPSVPATPEAAKGAPDRGFTDYQHPNPAAPATAAPAGGLQAPAPAVAPATPAPAVEPAAAPSVAPAATPAVAAAAPPAVAPSVPTRGDRRALPSASFVNDKGESHELTFDKKGDGTTLTRHSDPEPAVYVAGPSVKLAEAIDALANEFVKTETTQARKDAILVEITTKLAALKEAMKVTHGEAPNAKDVLKDRLKLEQEIGRVAIKHSSSNGAASDMAGKALTMMQAPAKEALAKAKNIDKTLITNADLAKHEPFRDAIKSIGMDLNSGFFGSVGKSYDRILQALTTGGLREKVQHVINWGNAWSSDVFKAAPGKMEAILAEAGVAAVNIQKIMDRKTMLAAQAEAEPDLQKKKDLKGAKGLLGDTDSTPEFKAAKKSNMDRKFPTVPLESLSHEQLRVLAQRVDPDSQRPEANGNHIQIKWDPVTKKILNYEHVLAKLKSIQQTIVTNEKDPKKKEELTATLGQTGKGESNTMAQSTQARSSLALSPNEERAHGLSEDVLPFLEGMTANLIDENNRWVQTAQGMDMPLRAGISGTTHRWMNLAGLLGADPVGARFAMMGHLIPTNAHSFHEIMVAAQPMPYVPGHYLPMAPLEETDLQAAAVSAGIPAERVDAAINKA